MPDNNSLERRFYSESEERYRLLIRKIRTAIVLHDDQGRILDSNPLAQELLGLSADQLLGKELIDPDWHFLREDGSILPVAEYPASLVLSTRQPLRDYMAGISRPDRDAVTWVLVNAEPECADDGEITQVIVSFVDITERKRAEDALYEAQQEFCALVVSSPDIIARYDRDCRRTYVNPKYLKVAGISEQELLASAPAERSPLPAASAEVLQKLLCRVLDSGVAEGVDVTRPKAGNIDYLYNIYAFPEFDREGRVVSVMTVSRDITERKQAEAERLAHLKFLENLDRVNRAIHGANDLNQMMNDTLETALSIFDCDRTWLFYPCDPDAQSFRVPMEITRPEYPGAGILKTDVQMPPDMALNLRDTLESAGPVTFGIGEDKPINKVSTEQFGVQSMMMVALYPKSGKPWAFGLHQCSRLRVWTAEEQRLFQEIGRRLADTLSGLLSRRDLRKSEEKYRRLVDTANEGIWLFGEDLLASYVNARMAEMLGYETGEMIGRSMTGFIFEEDVPDYRKRMENRHRGLSEHYERRYRHKNGQTVWTQVSAVPIMDAGQNFKGSFGMFTDITERKRAEETLENERKRMDVILSALNTGLSLINPDMTIAWVNQKIREMFPGREPVGQVCHFFYESRATICDGCGTVRAFMDGKVCESEQLVPATGRWYYIISQPIKDTAGRVVNVLEGIADITERKQAEEELQLNLVRQKALLDVYREISTASVQEIILHIVDKCVNLTGSAIGFVGIISDDDQRMEAHIWSEKAMENCPLDKPLDFQISEAGLWAEPVRQGRMVIVNDYRAANPLKKGYPEGHLELERFMGVPVLDNGRVVAVAGIANSRENYAEADQYTLSLLLEGMWEIIKRKRAEEALRMLNSELEERVRERTTELEAKNAELGRANRLFVGRELRMVELKERIKELESQTVELKK